MNNMQMMVPKRFGMLRVIGVLLKVLAWLTLVMGVVGAVAGSAVTDLLSTSGMASPLGGGEAIILALGGLLTGLIGFLALYAAGEGIFLQLAMEENTRLTAALLMKMDQESAPETGYSGVN